MKIGYYHKIANSSVYGKGAVGEMVGGECKVGMLLCWESARLEASSLRV